MRNPAMGRRGRQGLAAWSAEECPPHLAEVTGSLLESLLEGAALVNYLYLKDWGILTSQSHLWLRVLLRAVAK